MPFVSLFFRLMVRPLLRDWVRTGATLLAVALGVSVMLAIEISGNAAAGSFKSSMETLAGDADFEVTATGGVPDPIVGVLTRLPYSIRLSPRIEDHATVVATGRAVPLIGIDVVAEVSKVQGKVPISLTFGDVQHINDGDTIWTSRKVGHQVGNKVLLLINDRPREYTVRGLLPDSDNSSPTTGEDVILMDIAAAQKATGKAGKVDRILVKVPDNPGFEVWQERIRAALPVGVQVNVFGSRTEANRRMLAAFRWAIILFLTRPTVMPFPISMASMKVVTL